MSCNGCRVLRKRCSDKCILRTCLQWIDSPEAQAHATVFVAKFYGRACLFSFINVVQENQRPALFKSLLYEACGRTINPVFGAVGLLWSGRWDLCHAAVETVFRTGSLCQIPQAELAQSSEEILSSPPKAQYTSNRVTMNPSHHPHLVHPLFEDVQTASVSSDVHRTLHQYENYDMCKPQQISRLDANFQPRIKLLETPSTLDQRTCSREDYDEVVTTPIASRKRLPSCTEIASDVASVNAKRVCILEGITEKYANPAYKIDVLFPLQQPKSTPEDYIDLELTLSSNNPAFYESRLGVRTPSPPCVSVSSNGSITSL